MVLIIGGAHQGKLDYAMETYCLDAQDIYICTEGKIDFSKRCIYGLETFVLHCIRQGLDPREYMQEHRQQWQDCVFICRDIFSGVVPLEGELRRWRQETGRLCRFLAAQAQQVSRIFCGLEQRLK